MQASVSAGERVRALRKRLGLSQERLAERAQLSRVEVVRAEGGHNKMSTHRMRAGLARAFGLTAGQLDALLDGDLALEDAARLATRTPSPDEPIPFNVTAKTGS